MKLLKRKANRDQTLTVADEPHERGAGRLRGLTIYNGHNLPNIDGAKYEADNQLTVKHKSEIWQVVGDDRKRVGDL